MFDENKVGNAMQEANNTKQKKKFCIIKTQKKIQY